MAENYQTGRQADGNHPPHKPPRLSKRSFLLIQDFEAYTVDRLDILSRDCTLIFDPSSSKKEEKSASRQRISEFYIDRDHGSRKMLLKLHSLSAFNQLIEDLRLLASYPFGGAMVSGLGSLEELITYDKLLSQAEKGSEIPENSLGLLIAIDNLSTFADASVVARALDRNTGLILDAENLLADLREHNTTAQLRFLRLVMLHACKQADIAAIDGQWKSLEDEPGLWRDCKKAAKLGFDGKLAIHSSQVNAINKSFGPLQTRNNPSPKTREFGQQIRLDREFPED